MPTVVPVYAPAVSQIIRNNLSIPSTVAIKQDGKFRVQVVIPPGSALAKDVVALVFQRGYIASSSPDGSIAIYRPTEHPLDEGKPEPKRRAPRQYSTVGGSRDRHR